MAGDLDRCPGPCPRAWRRYYPSRCGDAGQGDHSLRSFLQHMRCIVKPFRLKMFNYLVGRRRANGPPRDQSNFH
jgi:hypothetical protein